MNIEAWRMIFELYRVYFYVIQEQLFIRYIQPYSSSECLFPLIGSFCLAGSGLVFWDKICNPISKRY